MHYRKGLRDPKTGAYSVQLWRQTAVGQQQGRRSRSRTPGVRVFAFREQPLHGTPYRVRRSQVRSSRSRARPRSRSGTGSARSQRDYPRSACRGNGSGRRRRASTACSSCSCTRRRRWTTSASKARRLPHRPRRPLRRRRREAQRPLLRRDAHPAGLGLLRTTTTTASSPCATSARASPGEFAAALRRSSTRTSPSTWSTSPTARRTSPTT